MNHDAGAGAARPSRRQVLRHTVAAGALLPGLGLAAGCSGTPDAPPVDPNNPLGIAADAPVDVVVADGPAGAQFAPDAVRLYQGRHPQSTATATAVREVGPALEPRFGAAEPPDVVHNAVPKKLDVAALAREDQLADLTALLDAPSWDAPDTKVRDTLVPGAVEVGSFDGTPRVLNYVSTVYGFWYSAQAFAANGWAVPKSWDELLRVATEMKATGLAPFIYDGVRPVYIWEPMLTLAAKTGGVDVLRNIDNLQDGAWKDESIVKAATAISDLVGQGFVFPGVKALNHLQSQTRFVKSQAGILPCGSWLENEMKTVTPKDFGLSVFALPVLDATAKLPNGVHVTPREEFLVAEAGKNRAGGLEYLRAMLSKEASARFTRLTGALTVLRGTTGTGSAQISAGKVLDAAGDQVVNWYFADWYESLRTAVDSATGALMAGTIKVPEWCERISKAADDTKKNPDVPKYTRA